MTVADLIKLLSTKNQDFNVYIPGYEGGLCDIGEIEIEQVERNIHRESYYGPHEYDENGKYSYIINGAFRDT